MSIDNPASGEFQLMLVVNRYGVAARKMADGLPLDDPRRRVEGVAPASPV